MRKSSEVKFYRIFGVEYMVTFNGCYEITNVETNEIVMISLEKNPHVKDIISLLFEDDKEKTMKVKSLAAYYQMMYQREKLSPDYMYIATSNNLSLLNAQSLVLQHGLGVKNICRNYEYSCPEILIKGVSFDTAKFFDKELTKALVIDERYVVYQNNKGRVLLIDATNGCFYDFYNDYRVETVKDIKEAIEEHLDYLNEHQYIENVIPEGAYATLMNVYEVIAC